MKPSEGPNLQLVESVIQKDLTFFIQTMLPFLLEVKWDAADEIQSNDIKYEMRFDEGLFNVVSC